MKPNLADFAVGDVVKTPRGLEAQVRGIARERLDLRYLESGEDVLLFPHLVTRLREVEPHPVSRFFLHDVDRVREGRE